MDRVVLSSNDDVDRHTDCRSGLSHCRMLWCSRNGDPMPDALGRLLRHRHLEARPIFELSP